MAVHNLSQSPTAAMLVSSLPAQAQLELLLAAIENANDAIMITDAVIESPGPHIVFVNPSFTRMTGYAPEDILGLNPRILQGKRTNRRVLDHVRQCLIKAQPTRAAAINYRKDGTPFFLEWTLAPITHPDGTVAYWVANLRDRTAQVKAQQRRMVRARKISQRILAAQEAERERIARDLHDSLGQQLSLLKLKLSGAKSLANGNETDDALEGAMALLDSTLQEVRGLARTLSPAWVREHGLVQALDFLINQVESAKLQVERDLPEADPRLSPELDTAIYRIAQELISNAIRHGQPSEIRVALRVEPEGILLTVSDNGQGFEAASGEMGMGLRNIRARVQLHDGMFTVDSAPGRGTYAEVFIPLRVKVCSQSGFTALQKE